jgi:hypothetical protein
MSIPPANMGGGAGPKIPKKSGSIGTFAEQTWQETGGLILGYVSQAPPFALESSEHPDSLVGLKVS